jgi:hypothetical protein
MCAISVRLPTAWVTLLDGNVTGWILTPTSLQRFQQDLALRTIRERLAAPRCARHGEAPSIGACKAGRGSPYAALPPTVEPTPRVSMDEQRDQNDDRDGYAEHQK